MSGQRDTPAAAARIQSVDRAIDLLLAVAAAPAVASVPALAKACGINRSTAWRLLKALQTRGMVTVEETTGRYAVGRTALELANAAGPDALIAVAHPVLERLCRQTGEAVWLSMPGVGGLTYVDEVTPTTVVSISWLGRTAPLHATSAGKAMLAFLPVDQVRSVLAEKLPAYTDATITTPEGLAAELTVTRARGYGTCIGEMDPATRGVAAPVLDRAGRPLGVLSICGPKNRVEDRRLAQLGNITVQAARELSVA